MVLPQSLTRDNNNVETDGAGGLTMIINVTE